MVIIPFHGLLQLVICFPLVSVETCCHACRFTCTIVQSKCFKILSPAQTECCNIAISTQIVSTSSSHCKFSNNIWIWFYCLGKPKTKDIPQWKRVVKPTLSIYLNPHLITFLWVFFFNLQGKSTAPSPIVTPGKTGSQPA